MFATLGKLISHWWKWVFAIWLVVFAVIYGMAPDWKAVALDGEFDHLPQEMDSIQGEKLFAKAFPDDLLASSVVIVAHREDGPLTYPEDGEKNDMDFIEEDLWPALDELWGELEDEVIEEQMEAARLKLGEEEFEKQRDDIRAELNKRLEEGPIAESKLTQITSIRMPTDDQIGAMLKSEDGKAALIIIGLSKKFLEYGNQGIIDRIENLISRRPGGQLFESGKIPTGLELNLSGTATVGRDMLKARDQSASATETWTVGLVIILLILIYRAPLLALIPLITVGIANEVSLALASLMSEFNSTHDDILFGFRTFVEMHVYMTVILYGAGVDYCLFLIARYKEELDRGAEIEEAVSKAVGKVGSALTASATTTAFGIGMMVLAEFGKFRNAGIGIAMSLIVVLIASLTLTPTLLRLFGRYAFWPDVRSERLSATAGWISGSTLMSKLLELNPLRNAWEKVGDLVLARPKRLWLISLGLMVPFALIGVLYWNDLSYGLLSELPSDYQSVVGAKAVQGHFPDGTAGPLTVLLINEQVDFMGSSEKDTIDELTETLKSKSQELGIADVRSVSAPLGRHKLEGSGPDLALRRSALNQEAPNYYITQVEGLKGNTTRLDVIFNEDPFSKDSISRLDGVEAVIKEFLAKQEAPLDQTHVNFIGSTANIRDLKQTTDRDRVVIDIAVLLVVLLILWILLRRFAISAYLILTVFFSYFVTIGFTYVLFWFLETGDEFAGLDWKVPMFLFTFLIAVGEDYNIYLMTRIDEEQKLRGPVEGIRVALLRTGGIISSCGIIMAGTFSSLVLGGSLKGMQQLGFALLFGVLLDTFVVRPILVPAYLVMLHRGSFGPFTRLLGGRAIETEKPAGDQNDVDSDTSDAIQLQER